LSKAFTREDVDPPERSGRVRTASGLPPGAANYITAGGARRLQAELAAIRESAGAVERQSELERILASLTIVDPPEEPANSVAFGAVVTVKKSDGTTTSYRVVGVDEISFYPNGVSWISPIGRTLLAAELGQRVTLNDEKTSPVKIVKIEYPRN
jgi:transcription elongation factor GreB